MLDGGAGKRHTDVVVGESVSAVTRGVVVATPDGLMAVWSHDASHVTGIPVTPTGKLLFGHPVRSARRASCVVSRQFLPVDKDDLAAALAASRVVAERGTEGREISDRMNELLSPPKQPRRGVPFWNGSEIGEGSKWIGNGGGRTTGKH